MAKRLMKGAPNCEDCGKRLSSVVPRVQEGLRWYCPDCYYHRTQGDANVTPLVPRQKTA